MNMSDNLSDLSPEERAKAFKMGQDALLVTTAALPAMLLKSIGWFLLGCAAILIAAKYIGWF